jgi:polysaccharide biosynthesis protein PslH
MRILYVVPNVPSLIRTRPFNFIRRLSRYHEISLVCLATNESDQKFTSELRSYCSSIDIVHLPRWKSVWNCVTALFSAEPLRSAYFYSNCLRDRVRRKVENGEVDLIHAEHIKTVAMVRDAIGRVPAVLDAVDSVSMFELRRRGLVRNPIAQMFSWWEWRKMMKSESMTSQHFNRIVISSMIDKEHYCVPEDAREKIHVVPNGVDLGHFGFKQFQTQRNVIVFCGKMDYFPNADAALHFSRAIWPLLRARRPELTFEIIGSRPPRSVLELDGRENIRVLPSVPDVRPHVGPAALALCPIRLRAGTQFKLLEAMALGVPVVATRICCPGLAVEPGKHLLVADTPEEFVSAIELLLDNHRLRTKLIHEGRKFVETYHDWNNSVTALCEVYQQAVVDFSKSGAAVSAL